MNRILLFLNILIAACASSLNAQVSPLLSTTWNQTCNYNADCPTVGSGGACGKAYTGCNATAIAQICKYYSYPAAGIGGTHCNTNNTSHCVDFSSQTYNYSLMPNNVTSANAEVAKLMYHLGIAVDMQWSGTSSNSFFAPDAMKRYFAYSPRMYATATFMFNTTQDLIDGIKAELDVGRPVFAKGGNHFYLIDGYNASSQFHINFGWSGTYDGYYSITSVVNAAGTFTPGNFIFMIRPLSGDLETASDTIVVPASASTTNTLEFTSLSSWTISSADSWLSPNMASGNAGYFTYADGSTFSVQTNNGGIRYGHLYIQNGTDTDTVVVQQDASPLIVNPTALSFVATGGTQTSTISYYSWGNWTASSPDSWISISPASGTGNATISITAALNPNTTSRNGIVVVAGGTFSDTIFVDQQGNLSTGISSSNPGDELLLSPNPAHDQIRISGLDAHGARIQIFDLNGRLCNDFFVSSDQPSADISTLGNGLYILRMQTTEKVQMQRFSVVR